MEQMLMTQTSWAFGRPFLDNKHDYSCRIYWLWWFLGVETKYLIVRSLIKWYQYRFLKNTQCGSPSGTMTIQSEPSLNRMNMGGIQDPTRHVLSVVLLVITDFIWVVQPHPGSPGMINSFLLVAIPCTPGSHPNDLLLISIRKFISWTMIK